MPARIALIGPPGTGKTSIAEAWCKIVGGRRLSFAGAVKDEAALALAAVECAQPYMGTGRGPSITDRTEYLRAAMDDPEVKDRYRSLLQFWGTDWRRAQDENYWVRRVEEQISEAAQCGIALAIDDCRFPNEYEMLRRHAFLFVRLEPGDTTRPMSGEQAAHESERHWPTFGYHLSLPYLRGPHNQALALVERGLGA